MKPTAKQRKPDPGEKHVERGIYIIKRALDQIARFRSDAGAQFFRLLRESAGEAVEKTHLFWQPPTSSATLLSSTVESQ